MLEFLLAAILAALIWIAATASPCEAAQWMTAGIPAWLQAAATLGAVWIAWRVFREWRHPELVKTKATQAAWLIEEVADVYGKINMARMNRSVFGSGHPKHLFERLLNEKAVAAVDEAWESAYKLERKLDAVIDEDVVSKVKVLTAIAMQMKMSVGLCRMMLSSGALDFSAHYTDENYRSIFTHDVREHFLILGWRERYEDPLYPDAIDSVLRDRTLEVKERLKAHLQFSDA